jgi:hypothetical protein
MATGESTRKLATDEHLGDVETAWRALLDRSLGPIVEMVARRVGDDTYEVASVDGRVEFRRNGGFEVLTTEGNNPLAEQATDRFSPLVDEKAHPHPHRGVNAYPHGYDQVAQLFDSPDAPDICVIHSASHYWGDRGGHIGEHGSIDVVQARAPFFIGGAGIRAQGRIDRSCRLIDIAPTVAAVMGCAPLDSGAYLAIQDGAVLDGLVDESAARPEHVVGFLLDGANANVLHDLVDRGEAPNIARLMQMGTTFGQGAMSSLPTVTLANHTSILTGAQPGHHGILHNAYWDRAQQRQIITNSPATWITSMDLIDPATESIHHAVHRTWPDALSVSVNEPCDIDADHSIFDLMRRGESIERPPPAAELPNSTERFVRPVKDYKTSSKIDHTGVEQAVGIWSGQYRGAEWAAPKFMWCNFTLTDAAFHEGGPYSEIAAASVHDTDARIGEILAAIEQAGVFDRTAFFLTADHGMEEADPDVTGDWNDALAELDLDYRDEGFGFIYVNPTS